MNELCKQMLEDFKKIRPKYLELEEIILNLIKKKIKENKLIVLNVESRVKEVSSLEGKLELKGYKYKSLADVTDLIGLRIITFYDDEVDKVAALMENSFDIDRENSVDKRKILEQDQFGYLSLHYICRVPKNVFYDENFPELNDLRFEIQMRTVLQHTWATINHDIGYKSQVEIPKEYSRRFSRLASLLEIADSEFCNIRTEIDTYRNKVLEVVRSGDFNDVEFSMDSFKEYLTLDPYKQLTDRIALINKADIEQMSLLPYYYSLKEFGFKTLGDLENMRKDCTEIAFEIAKFQLGGTDIDIIASTVGINYLCYAYIIKNDLGEEGITKFLTSLYGERRSNRYTAKQVFEIKPAKTFKNS